MQVSSEEINSLGIHLLTSHKTKIKLKNFQSNIGNRVNLTEAGVNSYRYALIEGRPYGVIEGINFKKDAQGRILLNDDGTIQKTDFEEIRKFKS